jgi:hypothetical protein
MTALMKVSSNLPKLKPREIQIPQRTEFIDHMANWKEHDDKMS